MEFYDVPAKQAEKLVKDSRIKESLISYHDTCAFLKDVKDAQRQYIQLQVYDMEHLHLNALQLVKGTLPRQKNEILLSESFMETSGTAWKIGDSITLPIVIRYKRMEAGHIPNGIRMMRQVKAFIKPGSVPFVSPVLWMMERCISEARTMPFICRFREMRGLWKTGMSFPLR